MTGTAQLLVTPATATLTALAVEPASASIQVGEMLPLMSVGSFSDGSSRGLASGVSWLSSSAEVATVSPAGLVTGVGAGSAEISASFGGAGGRATITVSDKPVKRLTITPMTVTLGLDRAPARPGRPPRSGTITPRGRRWAAMAR